MNAGVTTMADMPRQATADEAARVFQAFASSARQVAIDLQPAAVAFARMHNELTEVARRMVENMARARDAR